MATFVHVLAPGLALLGTAALCWFRPRLSTKQQWALLGGLVSAWLVHFAVNRPSFFEGHRQWATLQLDLRIEQLLAAAVLLLLPYAIYRWLRSAPAFPSDVRLKLLVVFGVAIVVRLAMPPVLLHSEQFGTKILVDSLRFPEPAVFRATYGQAGFLVLGAVSWLTGTYKAIFVTNGIIGAVLVVLMAVFTWKLTRSQLAMVICGALAALDPALIRAASSEDANGLMAAFVLLASIAILDLRDGDDGRPNLDAMALAFLSLVLGA